MKDPKKPIDSKVVYQNPWITVREDRTVTPGGRTGVYGYIESPDSVMIAAIDEQSRIYFVKAFRYPSKSWGWELPGGGGDGEDPITASRRELEEETGIVADHVEHLATTYVVNGLMTERQATCVAWGLRFTDKKEQSEEEVFADQRFFTMAEVKSMIMHGEIDDNQSITGVFLVEQWLASRTKGLVE